MNFIKLIVLSFVVLTASSTSAFAQNSPQQTDTVKNVVIKVKGINCAMDLKMISANVEKLKGVNSCKAGKMGTTSSFEVSFSPAIISEKEIFSVIENTGSCENPDERPYKVKK
jgi:copper chaperone CopZ